MDNLHIQEHIESTDAEINISQAELQGIIMHSCVFVIVLVLHCLAGILNIHLQNFGKLSPYSGKRYDADCDN